MKFKHKVWITLKTKTIMKTEQFVNLESVGSIMELKTENIYPLQTNGKPDLKMGISLDDVSDEWFLTLSDYDFGTIKNIIDNK